MNTLRDEFERQTSDLRSAAGCGGGRSSRFSVCGLRFSGLGFRVWGLGFRVQGVKVQGLGFLLWHVESKTSRKNERRKDDRSGSVGYGEGLGLRVWGSGFRVQGLRLRVSGLGFSVSGFGFRFCLLTCQKQAVLLQASQPRVQRARASMYSDARAQKARASH